MAASNSMAGAGLRIVVAPAARAREEGADGGQRYLELADRDVAFGKQRGGDIGGADQRIRAGNDDDGVVGIGRRNHRRSGVGIRRVLHEAQVYLLCGEERSHFGAERVLANPADQRGWRAEPGRRDRLVRAFAAGKVKQRISGDGLADTGMPVGRRHHIHIDAAGNENAAHA
jgi:hypothetical protein